MQWTSIATSVLASFLASMVEFVEALTIVLAVGIVRGWRSALLGTAAALATLALLVLLLGPALTRIPLSLVQGVVGALLLLFGVRWLRKAILRASGVLASHDEARAFAAETESLRQQGTRPIRRAIDQLAFATSFKIVMLEGIEVVFIVIAIGAGGRLLLPAVVGALLALGVVVLLALWLHRPLARVPENALKFGVGVMLIAFGTFWVGEAFGLAWPGGEWSLLALLVVYLAVALALVPACSRANQRIVRRPAATRPVAETHRRRGALATAFVEVTGLFIDDGALAIGIVVWVGCVYLMSMGRTGLTASMTSIVFVAGTALLLAFSALRRSRTDS